MNQRLLIAIVLSFLVLTIYSYLNPAPKNNNVNQEVNKTQIAQTDAPKAPNINAQATTNNTANKSAPKALQNSDSKIIATVNTKKYILKIDNLGRFHSVVLKEKKYKDDNGNPIDLVVKDAVKPLEVRFKDTKLNELAFKNDYKADFKNLDAANGAKTLTLTQNLGEIVFKKIITFYKEGNYNIKIEISKPATYFITTGYRPIADKTKYMVNRGALIRDNGGVITIIEDNEAKSEQVFNNATVAAAIDRYYTSLLYAKDNKTFSASVLPMSNASYANNPVIFIPASGNLDLNGYIGPKEWELFESLDKKLLDVIEFGWITFIAKPFFKVMLSIYNFVSNWGWAIILFTILVKIVLFPLSYKGLMSMQKLKDLAPKMQELRAKYKDDPMKMNQKMMELYKKHGANPMGGCLPMLLQVPIFFALYRVLLNADELQGAPWILWIQDLSRMDPYFVLPILMGATMYIQQKITPNTMTDPTQQKIFQWLPAIMTIFFITFPSGLVLYWLVNNILTIAQQYYINTAYEKYKQKIKEQKKA